MGSGIFPLPNYDKLANELAEIEKKLDEVIDELIDDIYDGNSGGMQYDNTARDGGYLQRLRIARELISDCYKRE